jgi:MFS family permease
MISAGGSVLEYYDFSLYGLAAALVFNQQFFPTSSPAMGTILALGAFGSGFLVQPIGSAVFSHFGDRIGRARVLFITMLLLGGSTVAIGCMPNYEVAGVWAPIGLLVLRLIQGFAAGGEMSGSAIFGMESAPSGRRGLFASFTALGSGLGGVLGVLVFSVITALMGADGVREWGWRIPFLAGAVIVVFVYFARRGIAQQERAEYASRDDLEAFPLGEVVRNHARPFLGVLGVSTGYLALAMVGAVYTMSYLTQNGFSEGTTIGSQLAYQIVIIPLVPLFAVWSDRSNRKVILMSGAVLTAVTFALFFQLAPGASEMVVYVLILLVAGSTAVMFGPLFGFLAEQFPSRVRYSGMGVAFAIGAAIGGGLGPVLAAALYESSGGSSAAVSLFCAGLSALVILTALTLRDRSGAEPGLLEGTHTAARGNTAVATGGSLSKERA